MYRVRLCRTGSHPHRCVTAAVIRATSVTGTTTTTVTSFRHCNVRQETERGTRINESACASSNMSESLSLPDMTAEEDATGGHDDIPLQRAAAEKRGATLYPRIRVVPQEWDQQREEEGGKVMSASNDHNSTDDLAADGCNDVSEFLTARAEAVGAARLRRNSNLTSPTHPDDLAPEFRRIRKHQRMAVVFVAADDDYNNYYPDGDNSAPAVSGRRDHFVALPPPAFHPWVRKTPIGPFVLHGDGHIKVAGTGEVGFDNPRIAETAKEALTLPRHFRGLQHRSVLQQRLPQMNGSVIQDAVVKNSFTLTGRGVFATREIAAGEMIMIVRQTARNLGVKSEVERLEEMCVDVLRMVYEGTPADLQYLHDWILTGQPSSLLEYWPITATQHVLERIGGLNVLHALELHETHIARLAAIMDMNSFLVESYYAERKGMAYFPEAGFLNHSCVPNATYDIIPDHTFHETDYYIDSLEDTVEDKVVTDTSPRRGKWMVGKYIVPDRCVSTKCTGSNVGHVGNTSHSNSISDSNHSTGDEDSLALDAPVEYLFCCRATSTIPAGAEILISYVPPTWSFDNRQYVLHDRYRFWCKCPKCAPTLDSKYSRLPKLVVGLLFFSVFLQILLLYQRDVEQQTLRERLSEEGGRHSEGDVDSQRRGRSRGLFELAEEERLRELYALDRGPMPAPLVTEPFAHPPR